MGPSKKRLNMLMGPFTAEGPKKRLNMWKTNAKRKSMQKKYEKWIQIKTWK